LILSPIQSFAPRGRSRASLSPSIFEMAGADQASARCAALARATDALPSLEASLPNARIPITGAQWCRSVVDAKVENRLSEYTAKRLRLASVLGEIDHDLAGEVRPAAIDAADVASQVCDALQVLAVFHPGELGASELVERLRRLVAEDIYALLSAARVGSKPPPLPEWPRVPDVPDVEDRDVLMAVFGLSAEALTDEEGAFCDTRVIAGYRLRLPQLKDRCDPIMEVIAERPPSLFTAVSAVRELATSVSPWVTLSSAREIRGCILDSFDADPTFTRRVLSEATSEEDEEWMAFGRLQRSLRHAERARTQTSGTERDYAVGILEAYRHMAEGLTRRWVRVLLRLSGLDDPPRTVGALGAPAVARLGELGLRIERAFIAVMRNAEAHDDFSFDEDSGLLVWGDQAVDPEEISARLKELDILQRALIVGRLAAFADQPGLAGDKPRSPLDHSSSSSALVSARQRFGHAGMNVRRFVRDRDRLSVVIDTLKAEACNPCFVALTQAAQILPTVARFSVQIIGRDEPIIDLPRTVLQENWKVFMLAAKWFPEALPQETFLPCLTWSRLACESVEDAARASAWLALNEGCHAILDVQADVAELQRLEGRFGTLVAATSSTMRLLPEGDHLDLLAKARRLILATGNVYARDPHGIATGVLVDRIFGLRDAIGGPVAALPTLDPTPLQEGSFPHAVS